MNYISEYTYLESEGNKLFTMVLKPEKSGKFPIIVMRSPYVNKYEETDEEDVLKEYVTEFEEWLKHGYLIVYQHCRGTGKSDGDFIPYIYERTDGLNLLDWIRKQDFYNGEIFLKGGSYLTSVHYTVAPYADDIKGAIFNVQDSERYNICYCNGFLKSGLHGNWYVKMYKPKSHIKKNYTPKTFDLLPLKDFTRVVFGEPVKDFDMVLKSPGPEDEFWNTPLGGVETRGATDNVDFPILFTTAFNDIYSGGIFEMWNKLNEKTKNQSALVVSPYDHGDRCDSENSWVFEDGRRVEKFGDFYEIEWLDHIRNKNVKSPFEKGKITYYRLFDEKWCTEEKCEANSKLNIKLGDSEVSYVYNPYDAPAFKGGLSRSFGGSVFQDEANLRHDIISVYTAPFEKDTFVKGKMSAKLSVMSDCEDTCLYIRVSIEKDRGDYGLRDDITSLCYQLGEYTPDTKVELDFNFDPHAFSVKKGERLRIDIASADNEHYVRHTNNKGLYSEHTTARVANNKVFLQDSFLTLPVEDDVNEK